VFVYVGADWLNACCLAQRCLPECVSTCWRRFKWAGCADLR